MAAVIVYTSFFLATVPMPGGSSIRQKGTIPSLYVRALPLSPIAAQRVGAVRCAIWTARSGVHSWSRVADPSGRCLSLHFCRPDGVADQRVPNDDRLLRSLHPPKSWVKTVGFRMVRVSDPSGQFGGPGGHSHHRRVIDSRDAGDERNESWSNDLCGFLGQGHRRDTRGGRARYTSAV